MSNEVSDNASAMQDRIDEVLSWEPGDPIYEQDYDSDWTHASNYMPRIRCTDCEVYWPEPHEPCWSCGKVVPLPESWIKGLVGDDRNTDERLARLSYNPDRFSVDVTIDIDFAPNFDEMWRRIAGMTIDLETVGLASRRASEPFSDLVETMRGFSAQPVVFDGPFDFNILDYRYRNLALPRQCGRSAFMRALLGEWVPSDPDRVVVRVQQSTVEQLPPTPSVFNFDLGLPNPDTANTSAARVTVLQIPAEIPTKQPPLPVMSNSHLDEINPALFTHDNRFEFTNLSSQIITEMRRSRHIR